ncbi:hypothetical protein [Pseudomonas maioricensis]|nr:hypothetical protein [Pseudomonas sp. S25]
MDFPKSMPDIGLVNGQFVDEDITTGQAGTYIPSSWGNAVTQEILNVIESAELEPREGQNNQLALAIEQLITDNLAGAATEEKSGIAKIATQTQVDTGTDDSTIVTPKKLAEKASVGIKGSFSNLRISTTGVSAVITITADRLVVEGPHLTMRTLSDISLSCNLTAVGLNGLDTGVSAGSTWYFVHVIHNPVTRAIASLVSLGKSAPALPVGFTHAARVGAVRTDATANKYPLSISQFGNKVRYELVAASNVVAYPTVASGTASVAVAASLSSFVPETACRASLVAGTTTGYIGFAPTGTSIATPGNGYLSPAQLNGFPYVGGYNVSGPVPTASGDINLKTMSVMYCSSSSVGILQCMGWEDNL